jgi:hypothetical protein
MNRKLSSAILVIGCLLAISIEANAQDTKPVVFTIPSKKIVMAKLRLGETDQTHLQGRTAFTLTSANDDDTVTGVLVYTVSGDGREKIAELTGMELDAIPTSFTKKDVIASFRKDTACPIAHLVVASAEFEYEGSTILVERVILEFNETTGIMPQLLCAWVRQLNTKRPHHGIIAAINRLIRGEE